MMNSNARINIYEFKYESIFHKFMVIISFMNS